MTVQSQNLSRTGVVATAIAVGAAVSVALGVYGGQHTPTGKTITTLGFGSMIEMKVWLALVVGILALAQFVSALWIYGKLGRPAPRGLGTIHRFSGAAAVIVSLPVAYHCLWSLGFQHFDTRVLVHSLAGCVFYGAFVTKLITLHTKSPGWMLPVAGGLVLTAIVIVVLTSTGWYLSTVGVPSAP